VFLDTRASGKNHPKGQFSVKHLLMDPAFPDIVGERAGIEIDDGARVWTLTRGRGGRLQERLDDSFLMILQAAQSAEEIAHALIIAAGRREIAETRLW
jgi:hypothetical protein